MDISLMQYRGGVRSLGKKKLADGKEYELFYTARTPAELAVMSGGIAKFEKIEDEEARMAAVHEFESKLVAECMVLQDGSPLMTIEQARLVPATLKRELRNLIMVGSDRLGEDAGKD